MSSPAVLVAISKPQAAVISVACSGATSADVTSISQHPGEAPQIQYLNRLETDVFTMIGGNDAGFVPMIRACVFENDVNCKTQTDASLSTIKHLEQVVLPNVYRAERARVGPTTNLYVLGYPQAVGPNSICGATGLNASTAANVFRFEVALDAAIQRSAQVNGAYYIAPTDFNGHQLCSATPYFRGLQYLYTDFSGVYHPDSRGEQAIALLIDSHLPPS
jgi:hypothetical protein